MDTIKETMQDLMDIIKRSKNSDMEEEYRCSVMLLNLGNQQQDSYALAFAHAYLADYYILTRQQVALVGTGGPAPCRWALPDR